MKAGRMNQRVTIQRSKLKPDALSGNEVMWFDIATVWAEVKGIRGREYFSSQQTQSETTVRVWLRYFPDVTTADQLMFHYAGTDGKYWDIKSIVTDKAKGSMEMICVGAERDDN
ncbi:TPA: phage head closure protein [Proteus mirabilis]|uniref:phage head closure protein n=1 Tax=Proteus TaxID=583 RepID=UPI0013778CE9|nr:MULTISPECIES: phage head closure protein [Proteus]EKW0401444.1 phage head closure protein [Proteus mirabilis]EKW4513296.1 phage head closure protein [Proteus mirabilis]MCU0097871.1 phage head closure protein [Proteus mirabilis]MCU0137591.1 phage head closure protein [Proteus mirabilis]NBM58377.1 phage head closure protein [Proteus sp. G2667]